MVRLVSWAASNGDRSENGDYIYGKRRLREIDWCIRFFTKRLDLAEVVDSSKQENVDQVFFGATIDYAGDDGDVKTVTIVDVSWISPWRALLKVEDRRYRTAAHACGHPADRYSRCALSALSLLFSREAGTKKAAPERVAFSTAVQPA